MSKDLLVYLVLLITLQLLSFSKISNNDYEVYEKAHKFIFAQSESITKFKDKEFLYNIKINYQGNVNQAKTIEFFKKSLIIRLGSGSVKIK